ncbi:TatD family hydrolase [Shewanella gelidii]|uniref:Hydrolase TatD family protein n=1 Tax=Shewanella gelidii TaxID=1642821 RepID=A0A917N7P9_9GAMM|nr:TatD family hydrolase [Shewanella gelidii]MCL1097153.1 TatD family hydrolase [Shewanella gelidii]GGI72908.1 hydrolase TatD family protein [Shewanella gelidii]
MQPIVDTHAHLDDPLFDQDREQMIERMKLRGIHQVVLPGISASHWQRQQTISQVFDMPFAIGIHPWFCSEGPEQMLALKNELECLQHHPRLVAIGECGLDAYRKDTWHLQHENLRFQLLIAQKMKLPVILHVVKAHDQILTLLKEFELDRGGVIHAFNGSYELGMQYVRLGFKLGIGSAVINERSKKLRRAVSLLPIESMVAETDSPFMPPKNRPVFRHSPLFIEQYIEEISRLRKKTTVSIKEQLFCNSIQLFDI